MNILIYYPSGYQKRINIRWLYGLDIIDNIEKNHPEWNFIKADGTIEQEKLYENIDIYLRPTRHDGMSRMIAEAIYFNIPIIWSYETGKYKELNEKEIEKRLEGFNKTLDGRADFSI